MCYYIEQNTSSSKMSKTFGADFQNPEKFHPKKEINAFDFPKLPIIKDENPGFFQFSSWGLIPYWAKNTEIRSMTLNARLETIDEVASFRDVTNQRCILPVTGFYEWKWLDSKGKRKEKYLIQIKSGAIFALAGLYSSWINPSTQKEIESFTLLTTKANPIMAEIHNIKKRMPLIMNANQALNWLKTGQIKLEDHLKPARLTKDNQLDLFGT